jgi:VIT1/CCC1 family predicted Fe2+/Mn2+ transporter
LFGINPEELGSPATAALTSLALFAAGALVPLLPWFLTAGDAATWLSILLTCTASLAVGAIVSRSSGRPVWYGAARQLAIVAAASVVTFGIGRLLGTTVS